MLQTLQRRRKNIGSILSDEHTHKPRDEHRFSKVWTYDGKILFRETGNNSTTLFYA